MIAHYHNNIIHLDYSSNSSANKNSSSDDVTEFTNIKSEEFPQLTTNNDIDGGLKNQVMKNIVTKYLKNK